MPNRVSKFRARPPKAEISLRRLSRKGRSSAFDSLCQKNMGLLKEAVYRYGDRKEEFVNNLHEARLSFWQALQSGVPQSKFRSKFFEYYKKNVKMGQLPHGHPEKSAVRLDNPRRDYHNIIPDKRTSLNMKKMRPDIINRPKFVSDAELQRRKERTKERRKEARQRKARLRQAEEEKKQAKFEELRKTKKEKQQIDFKKVRSIYFAAIKNPFLFPLGNLLSTLAQQHIIEFKEKRVNMNPSVRKRIGKLLFRIMPAEGYKVGELKMTKLKPQQLETFKEFLNELEHFFNSPRNFPYMPKYLQALREKVVQTNGQVPAGFLSDIRKYVTRLREKDSVEYVRKPDGKIKKVFLSEPLDRLDEIPF
jgi:hypothetical protein